MKKFISGLIVGTIITGIIGAFAVNSIYNNTYPIYVNGEQKQIQGYNVDDYSYFKLRDIADAVGGFTVDFQNDTIQIAKDGYVYAPQPDPAPTLDPAVRAFTISESEIYNLAEGCIRIPAFNQSTVTTKEFADDFIFYYYTGIPTDTQQTSGEYAFGWEKSAVRKQFKELFGVEMYDTDYRLDNGYYWVPPSNYGDERYEFLSTDHSDRGLILNYKHTDSQGADFGRGYIYVEPANNEKGYIITSIIP